MYLYGGESTTSLMQDFYVYESSSDSWKVIEDLDLPPARKHACMVCDLPRIYLLGGITTNGYVDEVWRINLETSIVEMLVSQYASGPLPFAFASCFKEHVNDSLKIYVSKGESFGRRPLSKIYTLDVALMLWDVKSAKDEVSRFASAKVGDRLLFVGGEAWGMFSYQRIIEYSIATGKEANLGNIPNKVFNAAFCYFKSSLYIHGGSSNFGNKIQEDNVEGKFYRIDLNDNCSTCDYLCSPGSYLANGVCRPCPEGTYQENFGASYCEKCPLGTSSSNKGNAYLRKCLPCPKGYYSAVAGSKSCLACIAGYDCSVGSSFPSKIQPIISGVSSVQPKLYSSDIGHLNKAIFISELICGLLACAVAGVYMLKHPTLSNLFSNVDIYGKNHNHFNNRIMYTRKSSLGGLFSVLFVLTAIGFISISFVNYGLDNIVEQKALVPLVSLQEDYSTIKGFFNLTAKLGSYGGECVEEQSVCSSKITTSVVGVKGQITDFACYKLETSCVVQLSCKDCSIDPEVVVSYHLVEAGSFAEYIQVNLTSSSSIPNQISSVRNTIVADPSKVFRGLIPSKMYFEVTSSVRVTQIFESESSDWTADTGYHIAPTNTAEVGSQSYIYE